MSNVFVSYAREDTARAGELVRRLSRLGHQVWSDDALRGGQSWWDEILAQIAGCDVFLAMVSPASLNSVACQRERQYAHDLGKPILPVAVERMTQAMPRELSLRQVVDYSSPGEDAAYALFGALKALPPPPPPEPLPPPPAVPLSYLTDLHEQLETPELTRAQQREIVDALEPALRSADTEEQQGGRRLLEILSSRDDLFADTERRIAALHTSRATQRPQPGPSASPPVSAQTRPNPTPPPLAAPAPAGGGPVTKAPTKKKRSKVIIALVAIGALVVLLILFAMFSEAGCYYDEFGQLWCS
jgi:hypothetical protein